MRLAYSGQQQSVRGARGVDYGSGSSYGYGQSYCVPPIIASFDPFAYSTSSQSYSSNSSCTMNPWADTINFSNSVYNWNPRNTRTVNMNFGSVYNGYSCWDVTITSSKPLKVLRFNPGDYANQGYCSGSNCGVTASGSATGSGTTSLKIKINKTYAGTLIFSIQDDLSRGCNYDPWIGGSSVLGSCPPQTAVVCTTK